MFDIGWSELLVIGVVTLIMVGPKELPVFLRTIGKYIGILRRQASEFRAQFDAALRETELDQIRKDVAGMKEDVSGTMRSAQAQLDSELAATKAAVADAASAVERPVITSKSVREADYTDENGLPLAPTPSYEDLVSPDLRHAPAGVREDPPASSAETEGGAGGASKFTSAPSGHAHHVNGASAPSTSRSEG
ncbi:MAG: Sec-independent protein translocase protein TatB [Hyphomicrobiaceae bacterium]|nr:Sec-independent protein translocase protein TatB [Hyphomicrobiaceae bacterium]